MGCDIHPYVEYRDKEGNWQPADVWVCDERWGEGSPQWRVPSHCGINRGRHYDWFAFIANVRNATWGNRIPVISEPKGLPDDVCTRISDAANHYGCDGHSHSWLTRSELLEAYKQHENDPITFNGAISTENPTPELQAWLELPEDKRGHPPTGYCAGGWSGGKPYPTFHWTQPLNELIGEQFAFWREYLWDVAWEYGAGDKENDVRVVFWFDN